MRNNYIILIFLVFFYYSCSSVQPITQDFSYIHPEIRGHVLKFNDLYSKYRHSELLTSLDIKFKPLYQYSNSGGLYSVAHDHTIINSIRWNIFGKYVQEVIVFHELGHHVLKRAHTWDKPLKDGCPTSLMYYMAVSEICYIEHRDYYIKELFTKIY